jgi:diacylglycerol kinase (ATP)
MVIFINPYSGAGRSLEKWDVIRSKVEEQSGPHTCHIVHEQNQWNILVRESLARGERRFVAAGGDGTVNLILNSLLSNSTATQRAEIVLGAIGLGSSNDFHKPFDTNKMIAGIPCKLDFDNKTERDIGCVSFEEKGVIQERYFLSNASIGITANANHFFNHPDRILGFLKKHFLNAAIYYSAFCSISRHRNMAVVLQSEKDARKDVILSNLAVIKNPHFSGSLRYSILPQYQNKEFDIFCCHDMNRRKLSRILFLCANGGANLVPQMDHWYTASLSVRAGGYFAIEYDGEISRTTSCRFSISPTSLNVCP